MMTGNPAKLPSAAHQPMNPEAYPVHDAASKKAARMIWRDDRLEPDDK